jgi:16S rRNA (adenine1518-N6/adenine1519-N6)-dimethyltransferase
MQKLGQHFLKNQNVIAKIANAIAPQKNDVIFEIGPGHGELTKALLSAGPDFRIICIEKDSALYETLKIQFKNDKRIEIFCGDALTLLPSLISQLKKEGTQKYKLVGNIPYYITGHLFRIIGELKNKPGGAVFMIQKEVAERIVAEPPKMNRLAASVQFWGTPKIIVNVPRTDFHPAPEVDSAVIALEQKSEPLPCDADDYYAAMRAIFSQPRKIILNNLHDGIGPKEGTAQRTKERIAQALKGININPETRPQNLTVQDIAAIAKAFL